MSDAWEFYFARVGDAPSSVFLDMGVHAEAPQPGRPWLLSVILQLNAPRVEDGLSSAEEAPTLNAIEDALGPELERSCDAVFVGRITRASQRRLYYYAPTAQGFEVCARALLRSFPEYLFELGSREDAEWTMYFDLLYPGPTDQARISNRRVIEKLAEHGDLASLSRRIDHWAYFASSAARSRFAVAIVERGFCVVDETLQARADDELPHCLQFMREGTAELAAVNEMTDMLSDLAEHFEGDYTGWECPVTRPVASANDQSERK